ncbi:MAG: hypothetical protein ABI171_11340, partial [Collimonas sp.]
MPGLQIIITNAGRAALVNAEHNGTAPLKITEIGLTAAVFTADKETTALPGEIKRIKTISGEVVAPDTIHVTIRDDGADTYVVRGIGYWLSNGVLLGVYSQPEPILQKSTQSMLLLAADVVFANIKATSLTFGDANFTNPPATVDRHGVVELATPEETLIGKDGTRVVTPAGLTPALEQVITRHTEAADPHTQYLTPERADVLYFHKLAPVTSSDTDCDALLQTGVRDVSVANDRGITAATHLPMGADGYGTLMAVNGGQFVRQVYSEGGVSQRSWERTGYLGSKTPFEGRPWKQIWNAGNFAPGDYVKKAGDNIDGALSISATAASPSYETPTLEIREALRAKDSKGRDISYAPRMSFHWGGVCVTQLRLTAANVLEVVGGDGTSYGAMQVGSINATQGATVGGKSVWHAGNFDPASKQNALGFNPVQQATGIGQTNNVVKIGWSNGSGVKVTVDATDQGSVVFGVQPIKLNWSGLGGQPAWIFGGNSPDAVNVYNPSNFSVNYANTAGRATAADWAQRVSNNADLMQFQWADPGGQTAYVWGSD